ncbi:hypothetical protein OY671_012504, partial [Metschnikowia pulcherrima]
RGCADEEENGYSTCRRSGRTDWRDHARRTRSGRRALRGRFRRRDAAYRRSVHAVDRAGGQRSGDVPGLSGRNPRAAGHAVRRFRVPDQFRIDRDRNRGRCARRAGGDEPGRAQDQCRPVESRRPHHRGHRRIQQAQP